MRQRWIIGWGLVLLLAWPAMAAPQMVVLAVPGIACKSCAGDVAGSLKRLPGITKVQVDETKRTVTVQFDDGKVGIDRMIKAIDRIGFSATIAKGTGK